MQNRIENNSKKNWKSFLHKFSYFEQFSHDSYSIYFISFHIKFCNFSVGFSLTITPSCFMEIYDSKRSFSIFQRENFITKKLKIFKSLYSTYNKFFFKAFE